MRMETYIRKSLRMTAHRVRFDRFHLIKHLNEAADEVRRQMMRDRYAKERTAIKGSRYLWLKNPWNLTEKEQESLRSLVKTNLPIVRAYLLKEAFQRFWDYLSVAWARRWLKQWFWWATHSRLKPLQDFAYLLRRHEEGIPAWTKLRISNGAVEGMNNKIKLISRRAYGFRDPYNYVSAIFHGCADLPSPACSQMGEEPFFLLSFILTFLSLRLIVIVSRHNRIDLSYDF